MKNRFYLALALAALISLAGWTAHAQLRTSTPRLSWEYIEMELDSRFQAAPKLNQFGSQGWELVEVVSSCPSAPNAAPECKYWAYMKRPKFIQ